MHFTEWSQRQRGWLDVVYKNEGLANKELMKFENQINNLADKWDR